MPRRAGTPLRHAEPNLQQQKKQPRSSTMPPAPLNTPLAELKRHRELLGQAFTKLNGTAKYELDTPVPTNVGFEVQPLDLATDTPYIRPVPADDMLDMLYDREHWSIPGSG